MLSIACSCFLSVYKKARGPMEDRDTLAISSCVRGYHVYKNIWNPSVRDKLECRREPTNVQDCYAVAVVYKCRTDVDDDLNNDTTVKHLPQKISCVLTLHSTWQ